MSPRGVEGKPGATGSKGPSIFRRSVAGRYAGRSQVAGKSAARRLSRDTIAGLRTENCCHTTVPRPEPARSAQYFSVEADRHGSHRTQKRRFKKSAQGSSRARAGRRWPSLRCRPRALRGRSHGASPTACSRETAGRRRRRCTCRSISFRPAGAWPWREPWKCRRVTCRPGDRSRCRWLWPRSSRLWNGSADHHRPEDLLTDESSCRASSRL